MADRIPPALKSVQPYLTIAKQFGKRDPVVAYYANMYAVQEGISLGKTDPVAKAYLLNVMDQLQEMKQTLKEKDEEALASDVVAQAHIEEVALRLFEVADNQDRAAHFNKDLIKRFFITSHIFTILKQFGELSEEIESKMKYAKWKAVEIDRCLKSGIMPTPGPPGGGEAGGNGGEAVGPAPAIGFTVTPPSDVRLPPGAQPVLPHVDPSPPIGDVRLPPGAQPVLPPGPKPVPRPRQNLPQDSHPEEPPESFHTPVAASGVQLGPAEIAKAQKLCKFASSALEYEDVQGAIEYLSQATKLLQTGKDS